MQRKEILNEIENNPSILQEIDKKYLSDEEFMLSILKFGMSCLISDVSPLLEIRSITSSFLNTPRSPCKLSEECIKIE